MQNRLRDLNENYTSMDSPTESFPFKMFEFYTDFSKMSIPSIIWTWEVQTKDIPIGR